MADSATAALRAAVREGGAGMVAEGVVIDSTVVRETDSTAMGDGGGVLVTATTTTGCILGEGWGVKHAETTLACKNNKRLKTGGA